MLAQISRYRTNLFVKLAIKMHDSGISQSNYFNNILNEYKDYSFMFYENKNNKMLKRVILENKERFGLDKPIFE